MKGPAKLKGPVKVFLTSSIIIAFLCVIYFMALPFLNFIFNPAEENSDPGGKIVINGTDVLDRDNLHSEFTPDDSYQMQVNPSAGSEIGEVSYIRGNQVKFEKGTKNVLLMGYNGEEGLCDSIFILNIDEAKKQLKLVSIPRDAYVPYSSDIVAAMKKSGYYYSMGSSKINAAPYVGQTYVHYDDGKFNNSSIDFLCAVLNNLLAYGCEIDQYVKVDLFGFMDVIDVFGGVYVTCEETIYDKNGNVVIEKGRQKMDARTALYYVRHRTRLDENGNNTYTGGDEYRKTNQLKFIAEVAGQIMTKENLQYNKVVDMMETLTNSVYHSFGNVNTLKEYIDIGLDYASGEYSMSLYAVTGDIIDPFGDGASYVKIY